MSQSERESELHALVLAVRSAVEHFYGQQAIVAEEQPHAPTGGPHLSWMLSRAGHLLSSDKEAMAMRWIGHVEGVLSALRQRRDVPVATTSGSAFTEQEKRVWASTFAIGLAANEPDNVALARAYEATWLVREHSRMQGFDVGSSFPKGWQLPER